MYTNKHAWTNKDGTYKEIYYYVCGRNKNITGRSCDYKAMLKKTDIEPLVIEAVRELVRNKTYANEIKKRIGVQIDTGKLEKEHDGYRAKLKEVDLNKTRLEKEIDSLPLDVKYRDRKIQDMTLRLDGLYDTMVELEEQIEDVKLRIRSVEGQAITLENIYKIMENFDCIYGKITDEEKRTIVLSLIKEIQLFRNDESDTPLKSITFNFPVYLDGGVSCGTLLEKSNTVETVVLLSQLRQRPDDYIEVDVDVAELEGTSAETKATYEKIKKYVAEHNDGMKVSSLYIAQVKRKCGIELAENFNLPKSADARQPQCPKDKEEAITEAFKAFQMI